MNQHRNQSGVARLLTQIADEYSAATQGLIGYAEVARQTIITAKMERMGNLHEA